MDADRFDNLARTLAARLPRRALGGLLAAALTTVGLGGAEAKKRGNGRAHRKDRRPKKDHRDDSRERDRDHRRKGGKDKDDPGRHDDGGRGTNADRLQADGKKKKKKSACVADGGSCKKPKKGKAKKCCAGLACDGATKQCLAPSGGGGGGAPCTACADKCQTCDFEAGFCAAGCGGADCAGNDRACTAAAQNDGHHPRLANHLVSQGYVQVPWGSRMTLTREAGGVDISELATSYYQPFEGGGTAELRTVANAAGESMSVALLADSAGISAALYVGESGAIERLEPGSSGNAQAAARSMAAAAEEGFGCTWCKKRCLWGGVQGACGVAGDICARVLPVPWTWLAKFAACVLALGNFCQEGGNATCDALCADLCNCGDGGPCDLSKCQTCQSGQCVGCPQDSQYCQQQVTPRSTSYRCAPCPACDGTCSVISPPTDQAEGTAQCPKLFCDGTCPGGSGYRCESSSCICRDNLVCGASDDPDCCYEGQTCCANFGLPSECCDWPVCNEYSGGADKGCCPAGNECLQNGTKICCPEAWMCGGNSPGGSACCVRSDQGDAVLSMHDGAAYCCSGELYHVDGVAVCK